MMLRSRYRLRLECRFTIKSLAEIGPRAIEGAKELPQSLETQILRAALDGTDVRTIKVRKMGKLLLRDALLFSPLAEDSAEGLSGIGIPIHLLYLSLRRPLFDILLVGGLLVPLSLTENIQMEHVSPVKVFIRVAITCVLAGCAAVIPPATRIERVAVPIAAPFAKTWEASVDVFAEKNIGVRTIDRSSGIIVADPVIVPFKSRNPRTPLELADCGRNEFGYYEQPTDATYNVRVRGDSVRSTVLVTVRWLRRGTSISPEIACSSTGVWEGEFEKLVKDKAESQPR